MSRVQHPSETAAYRVEFDWRGEMAYYVEGGRRVWLTCIYWGGRAGRVSFFADFWEHADGRREALSVEERAYVMERVIERARKDHDIRLEIGD